ncbi:molybdopterin-binding/glycosyltransferase family 2 protein [Rhizobiaceae bacterium n13]|uniref:Molybdopterin-binding/glycosyltransferase family 2 protein n=1 Tax=Ferirhizobium litorale TaxID=2927786 RepID=A0AAE3QG98_9HYPH|nr:molybdopterin-binding/glycosyltransferase family 2 protein [Fererhizobium litorale]MDI7863296.1 molybdopterin-binding/glycosyltransferase family 2 protein [Fererhizobium litorale]MDI7922970.1 molybdopterin-binding/glycosyltransferase family 2 protein [Fererhizobium litorale]
MIFGRVALDEAQGAVLAHAVKLDKNRFPKGHVATAADIEVMRAGGLDEVIVARLEDGDIMEDEAASRLAAAIAPDHLAFSEASTGRVNIHAAVNGLFVADKDMVDRVNRIDPAITLACLNDHSAVHAGDMVATFKIIPLAVAAEKVDAAVEILRSGTCFEVKSYSPRQVSLIATELPSLKTQVMDKTRRLLEQRLQPSGSVVVDEKRVPHSGEAVAEAIRQSLDAANGDDRMIIVFGASAVTDPGDVIPQAIRLAGGEVEQVGMPVDPGNLLVLGHVGDVPVIGAPGCARSPKENGFDWILSRILAGERPTHETITGMGVGGLLMEIATRPMPREATELRKGGAAQATPELALVLLAAGKASRMGEGSGHKLLAAFEGVPLVRRSAEIAARSGASPVVVVTGYRGEQIAAQLDGLDITVVHNADCASGMASSLIAGVLAAGDVDGVLVMLADMPGVTSDNLKAMIDAFRRSGGKAVVRASAGGRRGNPVILPRATFDAVMRLEGDVGARAIIETCGLPVVDVEIGEAARLDVDTPEAVVAAGGILEF